VPIGLETRVDVSFHERCLSRTGFVSSRGMEQRVSQRERSVSKDDSVTVVQGDGNNDGNDNGDDDADPNPERVL
jgi:hypothetical protein